MPVWQASGQNGPSVPKAVKMFYGGGEELWEFLPCWECVSMPEQCDRSTEENMNIRLTERRSQPTTSQTYTQLTPE